MGDSFSKYRRFLEASTDVYAECNRLFHNSKMFPEQSICMKRIKRFMVFLMLGGTCLWYPPFIASLYLIISFSYFEFLVDQFCCRKRSSKSAELGLRLHK